MAQRTLGSRVDSLEKTVRTLEKLPEQVAGLDGRLGVVGSRLEGVESRLGVVESQIVELRTEMRDGFSATRADLGRVETKLIEHADRGDEDTRRYMRMLFEEYVGRRRVIREGDPEP